MKVLKTLLTACFMATFIYPAVSQAAPKKSAIEFHNKAKEAYEMFVAVESKDGSYCSTKVDIVANDTPEQKAQKTRDAINQDCNPPFSAEIITQGDDANPRKVIVSKAKKSMKRAKAYVFRESETPSLVALLPDDRVDGHLTFVGNPSQGLVSITARDCTATTITTGMPDALSVLQDLESQLTVCGINTTLGPDYLVIHELDYRGLTVDMDDAVMIADVSVYWVPPIPTLSEWGMIIFCALLFGWMAWVIVRRKRSLTAGI